MKIGVVGASGYAGGELLRLLSTHDNFELTYISAGSNADEEIASIHQHLLSFTGRKFEKTDIALINKCDLVFLALPHGESASLIANISQKIKIVDLGANHPVMRPYHEKNYEGRPTATELVRRGYVVIAIDAFMFGERRVLMDADLKYGWDRYKYTVEDATYLNGKCRQKESTVVKSLIFAGQSWPGIVGWDDIRTVDYLITRPEVDASRIGCCGVSMGGYRTLYLAALDERIKAACIVGFMSTVRPMIRAKIDTHSFVHFLPGLHPWLDLTDVAALHAPHALMVQQCRKDGLFTLDGMEESLRQIGAAYAKAGVADKYVGRMYDAPHQFSLAMQEDAFAFFDRHLKA